MSQLAFRFGIICDDVRREDNHKLIFIGVYANDIRVTGFPVALPLRAVVACDVVVPGEKTVEIGVFLNDTRILRGQGKVEIQDKGRIYLPFPAMSLQIKEAGTLSFRFRPNGSEEWNEFWSGPIALEESSTELTSAI